MEKCGEVLEVTRMQHPLILEGTPEQLVRQLSKLPPSKRYRLVEVIEEQAEPTDEEIEAADAALEPVRKLGIRLGQMAHHAPERCPSQHRLAAFGIELIILA